MEGDDTIAAMKLGGVHHVSINVHDAEKTGRFYTEVLGLEMLPRPDFPFKGHWLRAGGQEIHLIEVADHHVPGGEHFAFGVDDIDATCRGARRARREGEQAHGHSRRAAGRRSSRDPAGNLVELNQPRRA